MSELLRIYSLASMQRAILNMNDLGDTVELAEEERPIEDETFDGNDEEETEE